MWYPHGMMDFSAAPRPRRITYLPVPQSPPGCSGLPLIPIPFNGYCEHQGNDQAEPSREGRKQREEDLAMRDSSVVMSVQLNTLGLKGLWGTLAEELYLTPELPPSERGNSITLPVLRSLGSSFWPMALEGQHGGSVKSIGFCCCGILVSQLSLAMLESPN